MADREAKTLIDAPSEAPSTSLESQPQGTHKTLKGQWAPSEALIEEAGVRSGISRTSVMIVPGHLAPSSFKADPRSRQLKSSESTWRASPSNQSRGAGQKIQLPPIRTLSASAAPGNEMTTASVMTAEYQTSHHILIPKKRGPSAYAKRQTMTHQSHMPVIDGLMTGEGAPAHVQNAMMRALAMNAELRPGKASDDKVEALQNQWRNASVGDLEALDSILDQLVVTDDRMREALLAGPPISFETIIHDPRLTVAALAADNDPDKTFITSVGMEEAIEMEEAKEEPSALASELSPPQVPSIPSIPPQGPIPELYSSPRTMHTASLSLVSGSWPVNEGDQEEISREKIPIPILPNLTRMYVTTKQSNAVRATPPLPPPTADYLLNHRPSIAAAAPSYDELCDQIKGVQRQYTCGTSKADSSLGRNPSPGRSNLDVYISGLDGPSLDQMVLYEDSISLERTRPTFVAMKKNPQAAKLKTAKAGRHQERSSFKTGSIEVVGGGGGGVDED